MNNLSNISERYNALRKQMDEVETEATYYEGMLLKYKGVECYVDYLSLYFEKVNLRVYNEDLDRFDGNKKVVELTLEEFDEEVVVLNN